jgi:hypothetical protein
MGPEAAGEEAAVENPAQVAAEEDAAPRAESETNCSFSADTPIATDRGAQAIGTLTVGDHVLAYDQATGHTGSYTVTAVLVHTDLIIEALTISGETITTTPNHRFFSVEHGWVHADDLRAGDQVRKLDGSDGMVQGFVLAMQPQLMYNLTVDRAHTFFVGGGQWLVHNTGCPGSSRQFGKKYGDHMKDYPGMTHQEYRALADSMYDDPTLPRYTYPDTAPRYPGETHIVQGDNLLRLDPEGNFRSLYPGVHSTYPSGFPPRS